MYIAVYTVYTQPPLGNTRHPSRQILGVLRKSAREDTSRRFAESWIPEGQLPRNAGKQAHRHPKITIFPMLFETTRDSHPTLPDNTGLAEGGGGKGIRKSPTWSYVSRGNDPEYIIFWTQLPCCAGEFRNRKTVQVTKFSSTPGRIPPFAFSPTADGIWESEMIQAHITSGNAPENVTPFLVFHGSRAPRGGGRAGANPLDPVPWPV